MTLAMSSGRSPIPPPSYHRCSSMALHVDPRTLVRCLHLLGFCCVAVHLAALTYAAAWVIALAAWQASHPELIRSPRLVLAHVRDGMEC